MQQLRERFAPVLIAVSLTVAALYAPPAAFALETTQPGSGTTTPAPQPPAVPAPPSGAIRIGLGQGLARADMTAPGGFYLLGDGNFVMQTAPDAPLSLALEAGKVRVPGQTALFSRVRLVPIPPAPVSGAVSLAPAAPTPPPAPANFVRFKGRSYRGEAEVFVIGAGLNVVNVVNLEEYLLGVVPREVPSEWPIEAVKAQAVAARTYAMTHIGYRAAQGFDLLDNTNDQEYYGLGGEQPAASTAVWATRGGVVTYQGKLANTMYHSSSGGHTENNEVIYQSTPVPYLRGVVDFDNVSGNRNFSWSRDYTVDEFTTLVGTDVGALAGVSAGGTLGVSGRPSQWKITGAKGEVAVAAQTFRNKLGLLSAPRSVTVRAAGTAPATRQYGAQQTVYVAGAGGVAQARTVQGLQAIGAGGAPVVLGATAVTAQGGMAPQAAGITVTGGGSGHAVGMSQWGAYGMALQGKTYTDILTHYYTGTQVETR